MDEELKIAAIHGDIEFLKTAAKSKPTEYFQTQWNRTTTTNGKDIAKWNIFHFAVHHDKPEFMAAAMDILPLSAVHFLLSQDDGTGEQLNPCDIAKSESRSEIMELIEAYYDQTNGSMDEDLKKAAMEGDVEFLKEAITLNKPLEYFKSLNFGQSKSEWGNIFHIAASNNSVEFFKEAMESLPREVVNFLLCQRDRPDSSKRNPLHIAAKKHQNKMVMLILKYYESLSSSSSSSSSLSSSGMEMKPWRALDVKRVTPWHWVLRNCREQCALKMLAMDARLLADVDGHADPKWNSLVWATGAGLSQVVLECLKLVPWEEDGALGSMKQSLVFALHNAPRCSDEVVRQLLEKTAVFITEELDPSFHEILNNWASIGNIFPFENVFKGDVNVVDHRLRKPLIKLLSRASTGSEQNPLHELSTADINDDEREEIARILIDTYKQEMAEEMHSSSVQIMQRPWLELNEAGKTPLHLAIEHGCQKFASYFLSLDGIESVLRQDDQILFFVIKNECPKVTEKMLELVDEHGLTSLLISDKGRSVLHDAPKCTKAFLRRLIERHPKLLEQKGEDDSTFLHNWIEIGELWPFEYVLKKGKINPKWKRSFIVHLSHSDYQRRNPFHLAASMSTDSNGVDIDKIVKLLVQVSLEQGSTDWPWLFHADMKGNTPVSEAIVNKRENVALCFLSSMDEEDLVKMIPPKDVFSAIENKCHRVVEYVLKAISESDKEEGRSCLRLDGQNVLHIAHKSTKEIGKFMIEKWPEFIKEHDNEGKSPLERASRAGATWLVELILENDRSSIIQAPKAWIEACQGGHLSTVMAFVEKISYFKHLCREHHDTPLHHAKFQHYNKYQKLLAHPIIKDLLNTQDSKGHTPLHKAIRERNMDLAELLINTNEVDWSIRDKYNKDVMDLLKEACHDHEEWDKMCKMNGVNPRLRTTYIHRKTDLTEMRSAISIVAALLATITFTAGFTLPGGLNDEQDHKGEATMPNKPVFLAFLLADTYAM